VPSRAPEPSLPHHSTASHPHPLPAALRSSINCKLTGHGE
jgi:hypothetical protein